MLLGYDLISRRTDCIPWLGYLCSLKRSRKLFVQYPNFRSSTRKFDPCIMQNMRLGSCRNCKVFVTSDRFLGENRQMKLVGSLRKFPYVMIMDTAGCNLRCWFCYSHHFWNNWKRKWEGYTHWKALIDFILKSLGLESKIADFCLKADGFNQDLRIFEEIKSTDSQQRQAKEWDLNKSAEILKNKIRQLTSEIESLQDILYRCVH